jgi:predicted GNAT family acetyltransferase
MPTSEVNVIHNKEENRFEVRLDSHIAELTYLLNEDIIIFTHTGVPPALEGRGLGSLLVKTGLDFARNNNLKVQSLCWFVNKYIQKHTEYRDLTK